MNAIAAVDRNWAIGREGGLLFHLPTDMKHFRDLTVGGTVILGRKTLETFPGGKPLKDRRNIVITRNSDFTRDGCDIVGCYDQALELTVDPEDDDVWVIGAAASTPPCSAAVSGPTSPSSTPRRRTATPSSPTSTSCPAGRSRRRASP